MLRLETLNFQVKLNEIPPQKVESFSPPLISKPNMAAVYIKRRTSSRKSRSHSAVQPVSENAAAPLK